MELISKYNELSVGAQVQLLFTLGSVILISILILISNYQIIWVQDSLVSGSSNVVLSSLELQMIDLLLLNSHFISTELSSYLAIASMLSISSSQVCTRTFPLAKGVPIFSQSQALAENKGAFSSKIPISAEGLNWACEDSALDSIFPYLLNSNLLQVYLGYELDRIFHIYPAVNMPVNYNPTIREWYYTAKFTPDYPVFTEPYIDAVINDWVISSSRSVICNNTFLGVAAVDITLKSITERLDKLTILKSGFFLLVSETGLIITMPSGWQGQSARLNDTEATGFPSQLWLQALDKNSSVDTKYQFQDINGNSLLCFREFIQPAGQESITHYLFVCALESEAAGLVSQLNLIGDSDNAELFWIVFSIGMASFTTVILAIIWYTRKIASELKVILEVSSKICDRALFPDFLSHLQFSQSEEKINMFGLVKLGMKKIRSLTAQERQMSSFQWGSTRPTDSYLFNSWQDKRYPLNSHHSKEMSWRSLFAEIFQKVVHPT